MAANPNVVVTLEGHADERGSREYNLALGERRAESVRRQMAILGASGSQFRVVSYGEERPAIDGHDEYAWSQNRRVEIIYR
jgi:peptidoglycan-associated lipoprotein